MKYKLVDIQPGYAEVWFWYGDKIDYYDSDELGVVCKKTFVDHTDFKNDRIYEVERWVSATYIKPEFSYDYRIGRKTGYRTRKEAIEALLKYWGKSHG